MEQTTWVVERQQQQMKKRLEATQTLRAGCSKANTQIDRGDYNTLRSLAHSVMTE